MNLFTSSSNRNVLLASVSICVLLLNGCAGVEPTFQNSNQILLERTVNELRVPEAVADVIPPGSIVALASLEKPSTADHPIVATIEDQLIQTLLSNNLVVVERDEDLVRKIVAEGSADRYRLVYLPSDIQISSAGVGASVTPMSYRSWISGGYRTTEITGVGPDTVLVFDTQMEPADYLVSYRVLECGILYRKGSVGMKKRESMVRLHLRVQNTDSGEVLYAENLSGMIEDEVDRGIVDDLANYHYSFYSNDLPVERGAQTGYRELEARTGKSASFLRRTLAIAGAVAVVVLAIQLGGD